MASTKIHVRPNGGLGKCSAKIKCDYAGEGAVHFEGPNAKQEADKFLEGISAYEYYKSVTTEELRESNPELAVAYGIDPDIAAFVEGKPNKYSESGECCDVEPTVETIPEKAEVSEQVEAPVEERPAKPAEAESPTKSESLTEVEAESNPKSANNEAPQASDVTQEKVYEPNPHTPGTGTWREVYESKLVNGEPLDPNEQKAFDTSYMVMNAINEQLAGQSVNAEDFAKRLGKSAGDLTAEVEADLLNLGRRCLSDPGYTKNLELAVKNLDLSSFKTLDPYSPVGMSRAYRRHQNSLGTYYPAENLELTEAVNQVLDYTYMLEKSDVQKSHVAPLTEDLIDLYKGWAVPKAYTENPNAEYRQEMKERWNQNLKPGSYITFKGFDTEVYRATPTGELVASDGKVWGVVNYEKGYLINSKGNSVPTGARIYKDAGDLAKNSLPLGELGVDEAQSSSDPGFFSRWENDPRFQKGYQAKIESNKYKTEKGRRNHEAVLIAEAVIPKDLDDIDDTYTQMKAFGYKNTKWEEKVERTPQDHAMLSRDISKFIRDGVYAGTFEYDSDKGTIAVSNREPLSAHKPKVTMDEALGKNGTIAERVSIRNAIQAKRIRLGSHVETFSDAFDIRPGLHNASSHRRKSWGSTKVPTRLAQTEDIILSRVSGQAEPKVWIVADKEKGRLIDATEYAFPRTKLASDARNAEDYEACVLPEETIESLLAQYRSFSGSIRWKDIDTALDGAEESYVW